MKYLLIFFKETNTVLTAAVLFFIVLEIVWPGFVSTRLNLSLILIIWLIFDIVYMTINRKTAKEKMR
jgi:hypothetical protein